MIRYALILVILVSALLLQRVSTWGSDKKVLLKDVTALTLHNGQMTTGRRSSPVPQLKCIGGSAGYKFTPQTVQCRNVGFDGHEVQWECKCDMDDSYRFGKVQVTCEGYDYPDDPYILKGSCGLEYTIDYTEAGRSKQQYSAPVWKSNSSSDGGGWIFFFILVCVIVFMICKMGGSDDVNRTPYPDPHRPSHPNHSQHNNPPPYGFKSDYTQPRPEYQPPPPSYHDATQDHHHSSTYTRSNHGSRTNSNYGGFWSGLGLGGIGGYLFGSRQRNRHYGNQGYGYGNSGWGGSYGNNGGWGSSWGNSGGWGSSWGSGRTTYRRSTGSSSSGTSRTTSGYGGTSRR